MDYEIVEIDSIQEIGEFDNEYVYDLEMDDDSHTFISNNILVHNTDSIFVGFEPAIKSCKWRDNIFNEHWMNSCPHNFRTIVKDDFEFNFDISNNKYVGGLIWNSHDKELLLDGEPITELPDDFKILVISGNLCKNYGLNDIVDKFKGRLVYNWAHEIDFIHGLDKYRVADYFKEKLTKHADTYKVDNVQDFELEKISESIINLEKKKYIQHITWEDGIDYERFSYYQPKGVDLVRSSTPLFARDKDMGIYKIVKYLFKHPEDFNIKDLIGIVKEMRKEFEMAEIDSISGQSSCSKYNEKVIDDKEKLEFLSGTHFAVKASAYHNFLLNKHPDLHTKYKFMKSGDKIKYYYAKGDVKVFAFKRGEYPVEFAPDVDYIEHFNKMILGPVNRIIKKLGMPEINKRLSVIMDIFSSI